MKLKVLSFSWEKFSSEKVVSVRLRTSLWQITVLDNHAPLLASIEPSVLYIKFKDQNNIPQEENFAVWAWVIEVSDSDVKVLADMLIDMEDVDRDRAQEARERALELMKKYKSTENKMEMAKFIEAEDLLMKSIAQLKLADLKK